MRRAAGLVFDEFVALSSTQQTQVFYTSSALNELLAVSDQMGIQVVVDDVEHVGSGEVTVSVQVQTSADGTYWASKNPSMEVPAFGVAPGAATISPYSADQGVLPTLSFARLAITFASSAPPASAHVRVYVTLRDGGDVHEVAKGSYWTQPLEDSKQEELVAQAEDGEAAMLEGLLSALSSYAS